jgi:hypothetical protein
MHGPSLLTHLRISKIWSFIELFQGTILILKSWLPSPQCIDYSAIMMLAILFTDNTKELQQINICHIYLEVITISNISDFNGTIITQQAHEGTFIKHRTNIKWPNQRRQTKGGGVAHVEKIPQQYHIWQATNTHSHLSDNDLIQHNSIAMASSSYMHPPDY